MARYLVVANQTLGGPALTEKLRKHAQEGAEFHVVVPATEAADQVGGFLGGPPGQVGQGPLVAGGRGGPEQDAYELASRRLHQALSRISDLGARATGAVGDSDPLRAMREALQHGPFDGIIISTLPPGVSRWVRADLVHRAQRAVDLPIEHVYAPQSPPPPE
jgi:hypothetical protein